MAAPAQAAGHELLVRPYTRDFHEVRGTLSPTKTETIPIELDLPYGVIIVGAVPVVTPRGARAGTFVLPTIEDVDVTIATDDERYSFGAGQNEGDNKAKNSRLSLAALKADAALLRIALGRQTGNSKMVFQFYWRDPATVTAAGYLPCMVSLTLLLARTDAGSQNALWRSRNSTQGSPSRCARRARRGTRSRSLSRSLRPKRPPIATSYGRM